MIVIGRHWRLQIGEIADELAPLDAATQERRWCAMVAPYIEELRRAGVDEKDIETTIRELAVCVAAELIRLERVAANGISKITPL
jgi:hypothetical protein